MSSLEEVRPQTKGKGGTNQYLGVRINSICWRELDSGLVLGLILMSSNDIAGMKKY